MPGPRLGPVLAVGLLTALTLFTFRRLLFDHWTFPWDFVGAYTTTPAFVAASVGGGHLLSWSPYVASGFPIAVDPQSGIYFPGWWLLGVLHVSATLRVLTAVQVVHVLFGSVGALMLARARRLPWSWATLAAVAYLFFGGFYGEAEHADIVRGFAYLPWLLWTLTPPANGARWARLAALPAVVWLIATGAYPAQVVSFGLCSLVYLAVALWSAEREMLRRYRVALLLALGSSVAVCLAVLLPYLHAEHAHELHRVLEPTAAVRAGESLAPRDLLGLYLSNFSWTYDGTVTSWAIAIPMLVGLACVRADTLRRQAPLVACGVVAFALAFAPKIGFVGRAMTSLRPLFPSRFPAADYKAVVAIAIVVLATDGWRGLAIGSRRGPRLRGALIAGLLLLGALLVSTKYAPASREMWLVVVIVVLALALVLVRVPPRALVPLLLLLVAVDGYREVHDYRLLGRISPWQAPPTEAAQFLARDGSVRKLGTALKQAPVTRPARIGPAAPLAAAPTGSNNDALGWLASGYYLIDYSGTVEQSLWRVEQDPQWTALMLQPWHAYTFPCVAGRCASVARSLPSTTSWQPSGAVRTTSYTIGAITYAVDVTRPEVMVENELAISGWHSNSTHVRTLDSGLPFRAWLLSPGRYTFTARYADPTRTTQVLVALLALLAWLGCCLVLAERGRWWPPFRRTTAAHTTQ
jgi:hypothetical protein